MFHIVVFVLFQKFPELELPGRACQPQTQVDQGVYKKENPEDKRISINGNKIGTLLIPKDNIISNSDFVVLTPITFHHNKGRLKRGMCGLARHNPQYKLIKVLATFEVLLFFWDA